MRKPNRGPIKVFVSYAHADHSLKQEFDQHLSVLKHGTFVDVWSDPDIPPGAEWNDQILRRLDEADLILMLVSPAFLASEFIRTTEMPRAMERHVAGTAKVIPIILRDVAWRSTALSKLQALPRRAVSIDSMSGPARRNSLWRRTVESIFEEAEKLYNSPRVTPDVTGLPPPDQYLVARARQFGDFFHLPHAAPDLSIGGYEEIAKLRLKLLRRVALNKPIRLTVRGTLFPCALLTSGWWERQVADHHARHDDVTLDPMQRWLFLGFDLWAPSWDFTWVLDTPDSTHKPSRFVAQLGHGDEADSLPVLLPPSMAERIRGHFDDGWGGLEAEVTGLLGHRRHFRRRFKEIDSFGGLLDYCLWVDDNKTQHGIIPMSMRENTSVYSGYLWKCVAPREIVERRAIRSLRDVYFVWDHTNFVSPDAVKYSLDALEHKEDYIRQKHGELVLVQKSSSLVPGECKFSTQGAFNLITGRGLKKV